MNTPTMPRGCSFLLSPIGAEKIFTPDQFSEEQRMFARTAEEFMEREILPDSEAIEHLEEGLMVTKIKRAGELGLLMIDIPEAYGGLELDKTTSMLCTEKLATQASFSVSHGAHTGIGSLPLIFFGNDEQKARYLPSLATGDLIAAYALTEPGSGSDALGARTTAVRVEVDGAAFYRLNGTKMWITNAGFADLFTVFAKVDGERFTAFLVERSMPGVSTGAEEKKMGIKGSSTRMLILEDVLVPEANVLGEVGRGHKIAFNILNFGRFKLGVGALGAAKRALRLTVGYAHERRQFQTPIVRFGAIRQKLADMVVRMYALESMSYRVGGTMDRAIDTLDGTAPDYASRVMDAIEEYAVEDSILKIYGSEALGFVVDECVQIHGGYGFSQEYEIERMYRDSRINRIFEGTNEINRMLIPGILLKRAMKGELDLFGLIEQVKEISSSEQEVAPPWEADQLTHESFLVEKTKQLSVYIANLAVTRYMADLRDQQEIMLALADLLTHAFAVDSTVARVRQLRDAGTAKPVHLAIAQVLVAESYQAALNLADRLLPSLVPSDKLSRQRERLDRFRYSSPVDLIERKRRIADAISENPTWSL
jgi:alkylation response protein AidB-like acyl-CoA dehydrogenase